MEVKVLLSVTNDSVLDFFLLFFFSKLSLMDMLLLKQKTNIINEKKERKGKKREKPHFQD